MSASAPAPAAASPAFRAWAGARAQANGLAAAVGGIFCLSAPGPGWLLLAGLLAAAWVVQPSLTLGGLLAFVTGRLLQRAVRMAPELRVDINCLLIGLGVGHAFGLPDAGWSSQASLAFVLLVAASAALVFLSTRVLLGAGTALGLPVLSLPFALVLVMVQATVPMLGGVFQLDGSPMAPLCPWLSAVLPDYLASFLRALGAVLFLPDEAAGLVLFTAVLWQSRLLALHALFAHALGTWLLALWLGGPTAALHFPSAFNLPLIGMLLGAFFLLPSWASVGASALATLMGTLLMLGLGRAAEQFGATCSTLPFNLVVIGALALLRRSDLALVPQRHRATPEDTLDAELTRRARLGAGPALQLPLPGANRVYQAFDGPWTHQGLWRQAYDFVRCGPDGLSYRNQGLALADYFLFGLPVLAPCDGVVVAARDDLADNAPGRIDAVNNWGNHVILRRGDGLHVELSHLQQGSLQAPVGTAVRAGQVLARCGNSGYSLYPHLHLQVQAGPRVGEATLPFTFAHAEYAGRLHSHCLPPVGAEVGAPAFRTAGAAWRLTPGEALSFDWDDGRGAPRRVLWRVRRLGADPQALVLEDGGGNSLQLALSASGLQALEFTGDPRSALAFLAAAVPALPALPRARFREKLPLLLGAAPVARQLRLLAVALGLAPAAAGLPRAAAFRLDRDGRRLRGRLPGRPATCATFDAGGRLLSVVSTSCNLTRSSP